MISKNIHLGELFREQCHGNKGIHFIERKDFNKFLCYQSLYEEALSCLNFLQESGFLPGDESILYLHDNETFIKFFWACLLGGIIPVPVTSSNTREHLAKFIDIYRELKNPRIITTRQAFDDVSVFARESGFDREIPRLSQRCVFTDDVKPSDKKGTIAPLSIDDTAYIQFTSGTTGRPKGVVLTHRNLVTNIMSIIKNAEISENDSCMSWMPLTHDMGLIGCHLVPLVRGINQSIMSTGLFIRSPQLWISKTGEYKATLLSSTNFGFKHFLRHFNKDTNSAVDLSSVRLIFTGAEPISFEIVDEFLTGLAPYRLKDNCIFPVYGMAEASLAVSFPPLREKIVSVHVNRESLGLESNVMYTTENDSRHVTLIDLGYPVDDTNIRIVDANNIGLEENQVGYVQIRGENVTRGYYNNDELSKKNISDDGWLNTNDIGFINCNRFVIVGRDHERITTGNKTFFSHDIEFTLSEIDELEMGKTACCSTHNQAPDKNEVIVFVNYKKEFESFIPLKKRIRDLLSDRISIVIDRIIPIKKIPKTTSGKLQRYKLIDRYASGEYDSIVSEINQLKTSMGYQPLVTS